MNVWIPVVAALIAVIGGAVVQYIINRDLTRLIYRVTKDGRDSEKGYSFNVEFKNTGKKAIIHPEITIRVGKENGIHDVRLIIPKGVQVGNNDKSIEDNRSKAVVNLAFLNIGDKVAVRLACSESSPSFEISVPMPDLKIKERSASDFWKRLL